MARKPKEVKEQDPVDVVFPPYGLDNNGRYQSDAGHEGAQAVYEYLNHERGRSEEATVGPDYSDALQMRRPRVDET